MYLPLCQISFSYLNIENESKVGQKNVSSVTQKVEKVFSWPSGQTRNSLTYLDYTSRTLSDHKPSFSYLGCTLWKCWGGGGTGVTSVMNFLNIILMLLSQFCVPNCNYTMSASDIVL